VTSIIGRKQAFELLIYSKIDLRPRENCKLIEEHRHLIYFQYTGSGCHDRHARRKIPKRSDSYLYSVVQKLYMGIMCIKQPV
jgi:hypothetical protein